MGEQQRKTARAWPILLRVRPLYTFASVIKVVEGKIVCEMETINLGSKKGVETEMKKGGHVTRHG